MCEARAKSAAMAGDANMASTAVMRHTGGLCGLEQMGRTSIGLAWYKLGRWAVIVKFAVRELGRRYHGRHGR